MVHGRRAPGLRIQVMSGVDVAIHGSARRFGDRKTGYPKAIWFSFNSLGGDAADGNLGLDRTGSLAYRAKVRIGHYRRVGKLCYTLLAIRKSRVPLTYLYKLVSTYYNWSY